MSYVETEADITFLREGGKRLAKVMKEVSEMIAPGVTTLELEAYTRKRMEALGGVPAFLGYTPQGSPRAYPAALCTSVNEEVVHGIPNESPKTLHEGDIITIDSGFRYEGWITDMAITVGVGTLEEKVAQLVEVARGARDRAVKMIRPGVTTGDIGHAVETFAQGNGYSVPHELGGHGVGKQVHDEPFIPNAGTQGTGSVIEEGMVLAIEPIMIAGAGCIELQEDGYTFVTRDGSLAAQFEHTVLVQKDGGEILTVYRL